METVNDLLDCCKRIKLVDEIIEISTINLKPTYINLIECEFALLDNLLGHVEVELLNLDQNLESSVSNLELFRLKKEITKLKNELQLRYKDPVS